MPTRKAAPPLPTSATTENPLASPAAVESLLPDGWEEHWDDGNQRHYYSNDLTGETSWVMPEGEQPAAADPEPLAAQPHARPAQPAGLPAGWEEHWDEGNERHYYVNAGTGETSWVIPVVEEQEQEAVPDVAPDPAPSASAGEAEEEEGDTVAEVESFEDSAETYTAECQCQYDGKGKFLSVWLEVRPPPQKIPTLRFESPSSSSGLHSLTGAPVHAVHPALGLRRFLLQDRSGRRGAVGPAACLSSPSAP